MGVSVKMYTGYTIKLKEDLKSDDFYFYEFIEAKYRLLFSGKIKLIVDGFNGFYARLMYVESEHDNIWSDDENYQKFDTNIPIDVIEKLSYVYYLMYEEKLDVDRIEYSNWFHHY